MSKPILLCALALAVLPVAALAHGDNHDKAPAGDRLVVVRDPETGMLRAPTAAELEAMAARASRQAEVRIGAAAAPQQKAHASGARGVRLTDDFMSYAVVTRAADGRLVKQCVDGAQNIPAALDAAPNAASSSHAAKE